MALVIVAFVFLGMLVPTSLWLGLLITAAFAAVWLWIFGVDS
jgi:hypothetical protein